MSKVKLNIRFINRNGTKKVTSRSMNICRIGLGVSVFVTVACVAVGVVGIVCAATISRSVIVGIVSTRLTSIVSVTIGVVPCWGLCWCWWC